MKQPQVHPTRPARASCRAQVRPDGPDTTTATRRPDFQEDGCVVFRFGNEAKTLPYAGVGDAPEERRRVRRTPARDVGSGGGAPHLHPRDRRREVLKPSSRRPPNPPRSVSRSLCVDRADSRHDFKSS